MRPHLQRDWSAQHQRRQKPSPEWLHLAPLFGFAVDDSPEVGAHVYHTRAVARFHARRDSQSPHAVVAYCTRQAWTAQFQKSVRVIKKMQVTSTCMTTPMLKTALEATHKYFFGRPDVSGTATPRRVDTPGFVRVPPAHWLNYACTSPWAAPAVPQTPPPLSRGPSHHATASSGTRVRACVQAPRLAFTMQCGVPSTLGLSSKRRDPDGIAGCGGNNDPGDRRTKLCFHELPHAALGVVGCLRSSTEARCVLDVTLASVPMYTYTYAAIYAYERQYA